MTTNSYIIKTKIHGVKVLTIDELESKQFSLKLLLEAYEENWVYTDSLQVQISSSDIFVATTQNERVEVGKYKKTVKVMKINIAKI